MTRLPAPQPTASHSNRDPAELQQPLPEHPVLVVHCALKPSHRPCYPMLQVAHGVSTPHSTSQSMQGVRSRARKELEEKRAKLKLFQDHQHHNSNNHQQSTEIQLSQDLQQQYSYKNNLHKTTYNK